MQLNLPRNTTTLTDLQKDSKVEIQIAQNKYTDLDLLSQIYSNNGTFDEISGYEIEFLDSNEDLFFTDFENSNGNIFKYKYNSDYSGIIITGIDEFADEFTSFLYIPDKIYGVDVVEIGVSAFANCSNFNYIKLPTNLKVINDFAFYKTSIIEIDIPSGVTDITKCAFAECENLDTVFLVGERDKSKDIKINDNNNLGYYGWTDNLTGSKRVDCRYVNFALTNIDESAFFLTNPLVQCKWINSQTGFVEKSEIRNENFNTISLVYGNYHYLIYSKTKFSSNINNVMCVYEIKPKYDEGFTVDSFNEWIYNLNNNGNAENLRDSLPLFNGNCQCRLLFSYKNAACTGSRSANKSEGLPFSPLLLFGKVLGLGKFAYAHPNIDIFSNFYLFYTLPTNEVIINNIFNDIIFYGSEFFNSKCGFFVMFRNLGINDSDGSMKIFGNKYISYAGGYHDDKNGSTHDIYRFFIKSEKNSNYAEALFIPPNNYNSVWYNRSDYKIVVYDKEVFSVEPWGRRDLLPSNKSLSSLSPYCFSGSSDTLSVCFHSAPDLKIFKEYAFAESKNLNEITTSGLTNLEIIEQYCFKNCIALSSIDLSVTKLSTLNCGTFYGCSSLNTIWLPSSLTSMEEDGHSFIEANSLSNIIFNYPEGSESENKFSNLEFSNNSENSSKKHRLLQLSTENKNRIITYYNGYNSNQADTFNLYLSNATNLNTDDVYLQNYNIGKFAFYKNTHISNLVIASGSEIYNSAFEGSSIKSISCNTNENIIFYSDCFKNCSELENISIKGTSIYLNNSETKISSLLDIFSKEIFSETASSVDISNSDFKFIPRKLCYNNTKLSSFNLKDSNIKFIDTSAFYGCVGLSSISIPSCTICIEDDAFSNCTNLLSIFIDQYEDKSPLSNQKEQWGISLTTKIYWKEPPETPDKPDLPEISDILSIQYNSNCDPGVVYIDEVSSSEIADYKIKEYSFNNFENLRSKYNNTKYEKILRSWSSHPIENNKIFKENTYISSLINDKVVSIVNNLINIYAFWTEPYFIKFNKKLPDNSQSLSIFGEMPNQTIAIDVPEKLNKNEFYLNWHTFIGWTSSLNSNTVDLSDEEIVYNKAKKFEDFNLYTLWNDTYYVNYHLSNEILSEEFTYNESGTILDGNKILDDLSNKYDCVGWSSLSNSEILYEKNDTATNVSPVSANNVNLSAQLKPVFWLRFEKNALSDDIEGYMPDQRFIYDRAAKINKNIFSSKNSVFDFWEAPNGRKYYDEEIISNLTETPGEIITLCAQWEPYIFRYRYDDTNSVAYLCATYGNPISVDIPETTVKNGREYTVVGIDNTAFYDHRFKTADDLIYKRCDRISSITLPVTISTISFNTFHKLSNLTQINTISGTTITFIDDSVFSECTSLSDIILPDSVSSIYDYAFYKCKNLLTLKDLKTLKQIGNHAFYDSNLKVLFDDLSNVIDIGEDAFFNCNNIFGLNLKTCEHIGDRAFFDCNNIKNVYLNDVVNINEGNLGNVFSFNYAELENFEINQKNENIKIISEALFLGCENLSNVSLNNSMLSIYDDAFNGCSEISTFDIPSSVTYIGENVFLNASKLSNIIVDENNKYYFSDEGVLYKYVSEEDYDVPDTLSLLLDELSSVLSDLNELF